MAHDGTICPTTRGLTNGAGIRPRLGRHPLAKGSDMERTLYHASSHDWGVLSVGDVITLRPGAQNAQGVGVYFSAGAPDIRASDSVHANGLRALFRVTVSGPSALRRRWYVSKGGRDRAKGRPQTWHSLGKAVRLTITAVDGHNVAAIGELLI